MAVNLPILNLITESFKSLLISSRIFNHFPKYSAKVPRIFMKMFGISAHLLRFTCYIHPTALPRPHCDTFG